jgi:tetratricopeptide (TPR) repeat protein
VLGLLLVGTIQLAAQQKEADEAWAQGRYDAARAGYARVLAQDPTAARANLRTGIILSWKGKLDSSLVYIARARAADPRDTDMRLVHARILAWDKQYRAALALYDSVTTAQPTSRDARLGRAQTLAWAGRLVEAQAIYNGIIAKDSTDRDARVGSAQISAWQGDLRGAERAYIGVLRKNPRDADARAGLGYVYLWQGRGAAAGRQARAALKVDSTHREGRALHRAVREATRPSVETSANWSNDSDRNTSFWQNLGTSAHLAQGVAAFASVNALETKDPVREATRVGGEAGLNLVLGRFQLSGAAGARRLDPEVTAPRTAATYRGRIGFRPVPGFGVGVGYSRAPFDEIASLMERNLDLEVLEAGFDARPFKGFSAFASGSGLWLNDGNFRSGAALGLTQKFARRFFVGMFGRTLSYDRRGIGYFSPDRFSVLEATGGYDLEQGSWAAGLSGGLGAQQVGERGAAQTEWHLEGRVGRRWGAGNRLDLFGMVTNSAVSSTSGAFRYRSAGVSLKLGL